MSKMYSTVDSHEESFNGFVSFLATCSLALTLSILKIYDRGFYFTKQVLIILKIVLN